MRPPILRAGRLLAVGVLLTMILATVASAAGSTETQGASIPFTLADSHVGYGQRLHATGRLSASDAGRTVALVQQAAGGPSRVLGSAPVGPDGAFAVDGRAHRSGDVRVVLAHTGGQAAATTAAGPVRHVLVDAQLRATVRHLNVRAGHAAVVRGFVKPRIAGRAVALQALVHRRWRTVDVDRTNRFGSFVLRERRGPGSMRVRLRFGGDARNTAQERRVGRLSVLRAALASWYGPGFYGSGLACGGTMSPTVLGVANKSLPCGTKVTLHYRGRTVRVPVIDRGPYSGAREFDLTSATAHRLGFGGVGTVWVTT